MQDRHARRAAVALAGLLAAASADGQTADYYHLDGLGSVRVVTNAAGSAVERHDYLPFGDGWNPPPAGQPRRFTGKERDPETGFDYFAARYYASGLARFTSVDPLPVQAALPDPQQWNRYAYARNNPLRYLDPTGRYVFDGSVGAEEQKRFKAALRAADTAARQLQNGNERADVENTLLAYGNEGDPGVVVSFGASGRGGSIEQGIEKGTYRVSLNRGLTTDQLAIAIAHEGQHLLDMRAAAAGKAVASDRDQEIRAYEISAWVAKGLGWTELRMPGDRKRDYVIWDSQTGMRTQDLSDFIAQSPHYRPGVR